MRKSGEAVEEGEVTKEVGVLNALGSNVPWLADPVTEVVELYACEIIPRKIQIIVEVHQQRGLGGVRAFRSIRRIYPSIYIDRLLCTHLLPGTSRHIRRLLWGSFNQGTVNFYDTVGGTGFVAPHNIVALIGAEEFKAFEPSNVRI